MGFVGTAQYRPQTGEGSFEEGKYSLDQVYRVITNDVTMDGTAVVTCPGLPQEFQSHPALPQLRARRFHPVRIMPGSAIWEVTVTYETPALKESSRGSSPNDSTRGTGVETPGEHTNPLIELPVIKFHVTSREVPIVQVYDAVTGILKPPTSSNGEPYDPPPRMLKRFITLEISRNEPLTANHPGLAIAYTNAVNSDVFWGLAPGVWMIKDITAERAVKQLANGDVYVYLRVTYQLEGTDTWDLNILDYGSFYMVQNSANANAPAQILKFLTTDGHPTVGPLNGMGAPLVRNQQVSLNVGTATFTIVSPAPGNTLKNGDVVQFATVGGSLPIGIFPGVAYFVRNAAGSPTGNQFQIAATVSGNIITAGSFQRGGFLNLGKPEVTYMATAGITVGMNVSGNGIPGGTTVIAVQGAAGLIVLSNNATLSDFEPLTFTAAATNTGITYVSQPVIWNTIRPYPRLPYSFLNLPQSWASVQ